MRELGQTNKFIGFVQLRVGSKVFALAVQAVPLARQDGSSQPGGFFIERPGEYGIIVDSDASPENVQEQIKRASEEAARHIGRAFLN